MSNVTGIQRLRQAIDNQSAAGEACFSLPMGEARALCDEVEDELARLSWAEGAPAPKDADGEVVPLGTEELYTDDGEMVRVDSICNGGRLWYVKRMHSDKTYWLDSLHLRCPDSWERLEEDVQKATKTNDSCDYFDKVGEPCDGCPASIIPDACSAIMLRDVLRRAKALAGRSED